MALGEAGLRSGPAPVTAASTQDGTRHHGTNERLNCLINFPGCSVSSVLCQISTWRSEACELALLAGAVNVRQDPRQ